MQRIGYLGRSIGLGGPVGASGGQNLTSNFDLSVILRNTYSNGFNIRIANKKIRELLSYLENILT